MGLAAAASAASIAGAGASVGNIIANGGGPSAPDLSGGGTLWEFGSPLFHQSRAGGGGSLVGTTLDPNVTGLLNQLDLGTALANQGLAGVQGQLQPGFGAATKSIGDVFGRARQSLAEKRMAAMSDLKGNLAQRRIAGSSFANDSLARADKVYESAQQDLDTQEAQLTAATKLQELDKTVSLIQAQYSNGVANLTTHLQTIFTASDQARALASGGQAVMAGLAQTQAQIAANIGIASSQGAGQALGLGLSQLKSAFPASTPAPTVAQGTNAPGTQLLGPTAAAPVGTSGTIAFP